jgi:hypothetical protein
MPPAAEIAVEAAAVARNRRRDTGCARSLIPSSSRKEAKMAADSHSIMTVEPCETGDGG